VFAVNTVLHNGTARDVEIWLKRMDIGNIRNPSTTQNCVIIALWILHMACWYCIASEVMQYMLKVMSFRLHAYT